MSDIIHSYKWAVIVNVTGCTSRCSTMMVVGVKLQNAIFNIGYIFMFRYIVTHNMIMLTSLLVIDNTFNSLYTILITYFLHHLRMTMEQNIKLKHDALYNDLTTIVSI